MARRDLTVALLGGYSLRQGVLVQCMLRATGGGAQRAARDLLLSLGTGNPRYAHVVRSACLTLMPCANALAQRASQLMALYDKNVK